MGALPPYFDALIAARRAGHVGRNVHLGYWDDPASPSGFDAAQARLTLQIVALAPPAAGQAVLDIACGFGGTLAALDAAEAGLRLTGLNIDPRQLALCRGSVTRPGNTLALVAADACALPFASATFDQAYCVEAMFHFPSRQRFLTEAARIIRPGGLLTLCDILLRQPGPGAPWDAATIAAIVRRDYGPWPEPWTDIAQLLSWASAAGFDLLALHDWSAATLPSYRFVAPDRRGIPPHHASAGEVFRWMHTNGWLTYPALVLRRQ
jgi:SAM-dependent methyltransferase